MNTATNDNKPKVKPLHGRNFPSRERMAKEDMEVYTPRQSAHTVARVKDPHRIDKLVARGTITEEQRDYGLRLINLHLAANSAPASILARMLERIQFSNAIESAIITRISAKDQYFMLSAMMCRYSHALWQLVSDLCLYELEMRIACRDAGFLHPRNHAQKVVDAFDLLGDCLIETRDRVKYLEETLAGGTE